MLTETSRLIIALTGGIASGKTTVARILAEQGVPVIDADEVARELVEPGQPALDEIVAVFGTDILDATGRLDRGILRTRVFSAPAERKRLERILHPRIEREMLRRSDTVAGPYCVLAIPLLLEAGKEGFFTMKGEKEDAHDAQNPVHETSRKVGARNTRILVVDTPVERQIERACQRDGTSRAIVKAIVLAQASRDERLKAAHDVITNDKDFEHLRGQVLVLHRRYLGSCRT
uniref:Dephospho-CoA kinase n=1 Tax=Candidatus Kentrum sp. FM TaxID=2126340 RepID=A0A450T1L2_9GAMM|nr:MAG: dephospho-CoA kinase [Candidatus Kentron sp. FM]VFJ73422.1 MAG: dephospho-CoA kinase [Candidatus Kentron sp. FM]VFK12521.1 MAG: dephospho-CoA kinase [Candidatus Kentron sp. FM]